MATVQEYKTFAAECLRWATESELDEDKALFLQMAQYWTVTPCSLKLGRSQRRSGTAYCAQNSALRLAQPISSPAQTTRRTPATFQNS